MENLENKISDLEIWVKKVNENYGLEESLNNIRKCGEAVCKIIILVHYDSLGQNIIEGKIKRDGTKTKKTTSLNFNGLINIVCNSSSSEDQIIKNKNTRNKINSYLEVIRANSNPASHDVGFSDRKITKEDLINTKNSLKYILK